MRILAVEDSKEIRNFLRISLESEFFVVDTAQDGEKGLKLAQENEYDLIILDYILPKINGKEVCRSLRESGNDVPIIILSIKSDSPTKTELLEIGADDFITKPFSFKELLARIKAVLRRPKQIQSQILEIEGLVLDPSRHQVARDGKEIKLTRKEFVILEFLMKNKGRVVSRGSLMEHVWDMNADPFSNTIESHMASLRKKIKSAKNKKLITTISGSGYRIDG